MTTIGTLFAVAAFTLIGVRAEHVPGIRPSWTRQPHRLSPARLSE
jgi:hypothetical protein